MTDQPRCPIPQPAAADPPETTNADGEPRKVS